MSLNQWRLKEGPDGRLRCGNKEKGEPCDHDKFGFENPSPRPKADWPSFELTKPSGTIQIHRDSGDTELTEEVACIKCGALFNQNNQIISWRV